MIGHVLAVGSVLGPAVSVTSPGQSARDAAADRAPWFTAAEYLTGRGYRQLPIAAQMALAATRRLPGSPRERPEDGELAARGRGLWIGSSTAGPVVHDFLVDQSWDDGAEGIGPMTAPYFSVNLTGSKIAEEFQTWAGSVMCTTPTVAGADALAGALAALEAGSVTEALVCFVEVADGRDPAEAVASGAVTLRLGAPSGAVGGPLHVRRGFVPDIDGAVVALRDAVAVSAAPGTTTVLSVPIGVPRTSCVALPADVVIVPSETGLPVWAALAAAVESAQPVTLGIASRLGHWSVIDYRPSGEPSPPEPDREQTPVAALVAPASSQVGVSSRATVATPQSAATTAADTDAQSVTAPVRREARLCDLGWRSPGTDEWALVLGASSGFGAHTARRLAEVGYHVYGLYFGASAQDEAAEELEREITGHGVRCVLRNGNAAAVETRTEVCQELIASGARVRTAVHSLAFGALLPFIARVGARAGEAPAGPLLAERQMASTMNVMAHSLVWWVRDLHQAGLFTTNAHVWAMTSAGDSRVADSYGAVSAAKSALLSHVRQLAVELAPDSIAVNAIRAGVTMTPSFRKIPGSDALADHTARVNPHGRLTTTGDIADLVALATLWDSTWVTGSVIGADGGEGLVT